MDQKALLDALLQTKRIATLLGEVIDLSRQLAEAADRNDQVIVRMLVSMREEPIEKLKRADQTLKSQRDALPREDGERLAALLNGGPAQTPEEEALSAQASSNIGRLKQLLELDQVLSQRLTREKSVYQ